MSSIYNDLMFQFFILYICIFYLSFTRLKNLIKVKGVLADVGVITPIVS